ncbi:MAG: DUF3298 domain-containing protein [Eubacterium sp.]|nr:DUF3298 domain-containing protein [Eubacterium sp.]
MKREKKRCIIAILCALLLILSMAACSGEGVLPDEMIQSDSGEQSTAKAADKDSAGDLDTSESTQAAASQGDTEKEMPSGSEEQDSADRIRPAIELGSMYIRETDDSGEVVYVSGSHDTIRLSEESQAVYPQLAAAVENKMDAETRQVKKEIEEFAGYYQEDPSTADPDKGYEITDQLFIRRADRRVLSALKYSYRYSGGAHGYFGYSCLNLDAETGEEISLDDVIVDRGALSEQIQAELLKKYDEDTFFDYMPETIEDEAMEEGDLSLTWTLDPQGLTFYFAPYEIAPNASGAFQVTLLYDSAQSTDTNLFTDKYRPEEGEGYICGISPFTDCYADVDQDGETDRVYIGYTVDPETDSIREMSVEVNNETFSIDEMYCYRVEPVMVTAGDGRVFLYAWCRSDNDFVNMYMFDLSLGSPVSMGTMALSEVYMYIEEEEADYSSYKRLITDSDHMLLSTRYDLLSTYDVEKEYYISDNSPVPVSDEPYYRIVRDTTLTSVKDIPAQIVDEEGNVIESARVIPAGSTYKLYRTDGLNIVDALLEDGSNARLLVTGTYPQKVNGMDAEEVFEQLFYAG